eukprot:scaffold20328_cov53-Attheya_sp.AAC.2
MEEEDYDYGMGESDFDSLVEGVDPSNTQTTDNNNDNKAIIIPIVLALLVVGWHVSQPLV